MTLTEAIDEVRSGDLQGNPDADEPKGSAAFEADSRRR
jgi:hypothetical protein